MANILITFANGLMVEGKSEKIPAFYEGFIDGLKENGNQVYVLPIECWGLAEFPPIDDESKKFIQDLKLDICILFNNSFFDISDVVDCPILIFDVDSPMYYSNIDVLKSKKDRFIYFVVQKENGEYIKTKWGIDEKYVYTVPFFSSIHAYSSSDIKSNIVFVGTNFCGSGHEGFRFLKENKADMDTWNAYLESIKYVQEYPLCSRDDIKDCIRYGNIELVKKAIDTCDIKMKLSGEKRAKVLSAIEPLGLTIYGTYTWRYSYYNDTDLMNAYSTKEIYSIKDNQDVYNSAKIGISVAHIQAVSGFPWRIMDIMASNACLVTDYHENFKQLFGEVYDCLPIYNNQGEAYEICKRLIKDESERKEIVSRCNEIIDKKFRFVNLLRLMEEYSGVVMH